MAQVRRFEFPGTIAIYGMTRDDAAEFLEEAEEIIEAIPSVSSVFFTKSKDKKLLFKRGIQVDGEVARRRDSTKPPPSKKDLEKWLTDWRQEKAVREKENWEHFHEERRREDAEVREARRRQRSEMQAMQSSVPQRLSLEDKAMREESGLSQTALETRTELSARWISRFERGLVNPTLDDLLRLSHALNIPLADLIGTAELTEGPEGFARQFGKRPEEESRRDGRRGR